MVHVDQLSTLSAVSVLLMFGQAAGDTLPQRLQYHAASRYRLRRNRVSLLAKSKARTQAILDQLDAHVALDLASISARLAAPCQQHGTAHTCLDPFRENPGAARNWQAPSFQTRRLTSQHER